MRYNLVLVVAGAPAARPRRCSSAGESARLIIVRSTVRSRPSLPGFRARLPWRPRPSICSRTCYTDGSIRASSGGATSSAPPTRRPVQRRRLPAPAARLAGGRRLLVPALLVERLVDHQQVLAPGLHGHLVAHRDAGGDADDLVPARRAQRRGGWGWGRSDHDRPLLTRDLLRES